MRIKRFFVMGVISLFAISLYAQQGSASPYSFFGLGDLQFKGTVVNQTMGNNITYTDSIHVNLKNPANYGHLKLSTFTVGSSFSNTTYESNQKKLEGSKTTVDYLSLGFPISKNIAVGFGLIPYSSVGYFLRNENDEGTLRRDFTGSGGINKVFLSFGYNPYKGLSIGATANHNFGNITNENTLFRQGIQLFTRRVSDSRITGLDFSFGVNYKRQVTDKYTLYTSLLWEPQVNLQSENSRDTRLNYISSNGNILEREEFRVQEDLTTVGLDKTNITIPSTTTFGIGFGEERKWFLGANIKLSQLQNFNNPFTVIDNVAYEKALTYSLGGYYIPQYNSFRKYLRRIVYRMGVNVGNSGIVVNNQSIDNFGISFGVGLPISGITPPSIGNKVFAKLFSNINIGVEYGSRGAVNTGLIKENYFQVKLDLSLSDGWFLKRKID